MSELKQTSPQQIENQLQVVNLERHLSGQSVLPAEVLDPNHASHAEYAGSLRALRESEAAFLAKHPSAPFGRAADGETGEVDLHEDFSPLGWAAIEALDPAGDWDPPVLSIDERKRAVQSVAGLLETADRLIDNNERKVIKSLPTFAKIWGEEKLDAFVDHLSESRPMVVLSSLPTFVEFLGPDKAKSFAGTAADAALADPNENIYDVSALTGEATKGFLNPDQQQKLAMKALQYGPNYASHGGQSVVRELQEGGFVTEQQVASGLVDTIRTADSEGLAAAKDYEKLLERTGKLGEFKSTLKASFEAGTTDLFRLRFATILPGPERAALAEGIVASRSGEVFRYGSTTQTVIDLLGEQKVLAIFDSCYQDMPADTAIEFVLGDLAGSLSPEAKQTYIEHSIEVSPELALRKADALLGALEKSQVEPLVKDAASRINDVSSYGIFTSIDTWLPMISSDPTEQTNAVTSLLERVESLDFLHDYKNNQLFRSVMPLDQLKGIVEDKLFQTNYIVDMDRVKDVVGAETFGTWMLKAADITPMLFMSMADEAPGVLDKEVMKDALRKVAADEVGVLQYGNVLKLVFDESEMTDVLDKIMASHPLEFTAHIPDLFKRRVLSKETRDSYYNRMLVINPAAVYTLGNKQWGEKAVTAMRERADTEGYMPEWFNRFFKKFDKSNENGRTILMQEAVGLYANLADISAQAPELLDKVAELSKQPHQQFEIVAKLGFLVRHNAKGQTLDPEHISSLESLDGLTFSRLERMLGVPLDVEARTRLEQVFGPFVTYLDGHADSEPHVALLASIAQHGDIDAFRNFRFGERNDESLAQLKEKGLLPTNLTLEQYKEWSSDMVMTSHESVKASAQDVADALHKITLNNLAFFDFDTDVQELSPSDVSQLGRNVGELGKRLGQLHRELRTSDDAAKPEIEDMIGEIEDEKIHAETMLALHALLTIDVEGVLAGGVLKGDKVSQTFDSLFNKITAASDQQDVPQELVLAAEHMRSLLGTFRETTEEARELTVEDTIDLKTTLKVGDEPVGTCQNYATGQYRECLLGYTDPNTKIIAVRHGGSTIARSVMRLLEDEQGNPALHVETIYSQNASSLIPEKIFNLALSKAEKMGVPVFVSESSQGAGGGAVKAAAVNGITQTLSKTELAARGVRAPFVYVDSAYGRQDGAYKISKLATLSRA